MGRRGERKERKEKKGTHPQSHFPVLGLKDEEREKTTQNIIKRKLHMHN